MATPPNSPPKNIIVGGKKVRLDPSAYVAAGGEASIYSHGGQALRIYHERKNMPPQARLTELAKITCPNVVKPIETILDQATGEEIGFSMAFVTGTEPLCRFFAQLFRKNNNISPANIAKLVVDIQSTVGQLIKEGFLPVDLNEMNILPSMTDYNPWFIDIASWATPSFKATAIMESVRDPLVKNNEFTAGSTWYSFGVIATQLYLGIHPFHGVHPKWKMNWQKRMQENASIFEAGVKVPSLVPPFSTVPASHLDWLKKLFSSSYRGAPPIPGAVAPTPVTPAAARVVYATGSFMVETVLRSPAGEIIDVYSYFGRTYAVTTDRVYWVSGEHWTPICDRSKHQQAYVLQGDSERVVIALVANRQVSFQVWGATTKTQSAIDPCNTVGGCFVRDGRFYTSNSGRLLEHSFMFVGPTALRLETHVDNTNDLTVKLLDGMVYQDLLTTAWVTIPYGKGVSVTTQIPTLNGWRIIDGKARGRFAALVGVKGGKYQTFVLRFNEAYSACTVREIPDQQEINFTVTGADVCAMIVNDDLELFRDPTQVRGCVNPPVDQSTKLVHTPQGTLFLDGTEARKLIVK